LLADPNIGTELQQKIDDFRTEVKQVAKAKTESSEDKKPEPPVPYIKKITQRGEVLVEFTQDLIAVPNLVFINFGTVIVNGEVVPVLHFEIESAEGSSSRKKISKLKVVS